MNVRHACSPEWEKGTMQGSKENAYDVKYIPIFRGVWGHAPPKNFEKWSNLDSSGSYLEAVVCPLRLKCDVHVVGLYTSVKYWGWLCPPLWNIGGGV